MRQSLGAFGAGALVVLLSSAGCSDPTSRPPTPAQAPSPAHADQHVVTPGSETLGSPHDVAQSWFRAVNSFSWTDPAPTAWISRARPFLAGELANTTLALAQDGAGAGTWWQDMVQQRCRQQVTDLGAVIPSEAPASSTTVWVQVAGTLSQTCDLPPVPSPMVLASTVATTRQPDGTWRVTAQLD